MSRATDPLLPLPIYPGTKPRFHAMVKPTGAICNLDCAYCYYLHKEELLGSDSKFRISDEILEAHVRQYIESQRGEEVVFSWQGGEPTLLGVGFFEKVVALEKKYQRPNQRIENDLQTNGTLLNEEWLAGIDAPRSGTVMVGAGKSTIGRLLAGIDAPRSGTVMVGDVALASMPLPMLRRHVALVTQEHHIFSGSVRENLALAKPEASDDEITRALDAVDALEWVELLPNGILTELGSTGYQVSPSSVRQLALARLVLSDPHPLVLAEATALLDPRAARHLERSLVAVLRGRTVVAIAHRLHTAHDADRVCVVIDGQIAELGTHDELVALNGEYASLWSSWPKQQPGAS